MAKYSFERNGTIGDFQQFIHDIYSIPDDRLYSVWDLLVQQQRFTMRSLKGVRKKDVEKTKYNLLVAFSWLMAIVNRMHIDAEEELWQRFPYLCSYCGRKPCQCKISKRTIRAKVRIDEKKRPQTLSDYQKMFSEIYPAETRTVADAGVHLGEEMGEVAEAVHNHLGQHLPQQFEAVRLEVADFISCVFGLANSAGFDVATELAKMFRNNCHICHRAPCVCSFSEVAHLET